MKWFRKGGATHFEREIINNVDKHGCHINWIFDEEEAAPAFAYSVGFTKRLGVPEVILFGLPKDTSMQAINSAFALCAVGQRLDDGQRFAGLFGNDYACIARAVDESWLVQSFFASALWYHRTQMNQALEQVAMLVWPDADHRYPWEDGCADWVRADRPALYEPRLH
jgi:hypothetical protein